MKTFNMKKPKIIFLLYYTTKELTNNNLQNKRFEVPRIFSGGYKFDLQISGLTTQLLIKLKNLVSYYSTCAPYAHLNFYYRTIVGSLSKVKNRPRNFLFLWNSCAHKSERI
jgi:hypothetical protein